MISRRIGPTSPARTGAERANDADDTVTAWFDAFGLGSRHTTFAIGITPRMRVPASACPTSLHEARADGTRPGGTGVQHCPCQLAGEDLTLSELGSLS